MVPRGDIGEGKKALHSHHAWLAFTPNTYIINNVILKCNYIIKFYVKIMHKYHDMVGGPCAWFTPLHAC